MADDRGKQRFHQAEELFAQGKCREAAQVLQSLNAQWPGQPNILLPLAICFERMSKVEDAIVICEQILTKEEHPRARELYNRLRRVSATMVAGATGAKEEPDYLRVPDLFEAPHKPAPTPAAEAKTWNWRYAAIIASAILFIGLLALPLFLATPPPATSPASSVGTPPASPPLQDTQHTVEPIGEGMATATAIVVVGIILVAVFMVQVVVLYFTLALIGKLPHDEPASDLIDAAVITVLVLLLSLVPFVGWIIILVLISKHYDMGCLEVIVFSLIQGFLGFCVFWLLFTLVGAAVS